MKRTTVHLPSGLKAKAVRIARQRAVAVADLIREGLEIVVERAERERGEPFPFTTVKGTKPGRSAEDHGAWQEDDA